MASKVCSNKQTYSEEKFQKVRDTAEVLNLKFLRKAKEAHIALSRTLLITGPPGMGKTWLLRHIEQNKSSKKPFAFVVFLDALEILDKTRADAALPDDFRLIRNNFVFNSLEQVFEQICDQTSQKRAKIPWFLTEFRPHFRELLTRLAQEGKHGLVIVDHLSEIPENLQRALAAAWLFVVPETGHTLLMAARTPPEIGPWIRVPTGNIVVLTQGLSEEQIRLLLSKAMPEGRQQDLNIEETAKRILQWTDGHPWMVQCLVQTCAKGRALAWHKVRSALESLLKAILQESQQTEGAPSSRPENEESIMRVLHLLAWIPYWHPTWMMEVWKEWEEKRQTAKADQSPWSLWKQTGQRALLWLRRNGFVKREEGVYDHLHACPAAFFTMTVAALGLEEARTCQSILQEHSKLREVKENWRGRGDRKLKQWETVFQKRQVLLDTLHNPTLQEVSV